MKKLAFVFVVLGSGLAAFGASGWSSNVLKSYLGSYRVSSGWSLGAQLEITIGVMLLACGLLLRRDSS